MNASTPDNSTPHAAGVDVARVVAGAGGIPGVRLLTATQAMKLLNVSRTWLYAAARDGRIPSIRLGATTDGPLRFVEADLLDHIERARRAWCPGGSSASALRRAG
jgi:excisionase family DNA binding protein